MNVLYYNDPTLNEVMISLISFERDSLFKALNLCRSRLSQQLIIDSRYLVACALIYPMIHNCSPIRKRKCSVENMQVQIEKIARTIEPNPRWIAFNRLFWQWLEEFELAKAEIKELKLLNELERLALGFVAFSNMEARNKEKVERCFGQLVEEVGLGSYDSFLNVFSFLIDVERRLEKDPTIYQEEKIAQLESELGLKKGVLIFGEEDLNYVSLSRLHKQTIPMFYGGRLGIRKGVVGERLAFLNLPHRLCFALDKPRKEIIEGMYKGAIFEDFLCNVLRGELVVTIDPTDPLGGGYIQRIDRLQSIPGGRELLDKLETCSEVLAWERVSRELEYFTSEPKLPEEKSKFTKSYKYFKYNYRLPHGQCNCSIIIRSQTHPSFEEFLEAENVSVWEEDLLLLHDHAPKHCLVAQAKFTVNYSHRKYHYGKDHVKKFADYVNRTPSAKLELGIPRNFNLIPVLFTSFTGAIHKQKDGVLKTTILPVLQNRFLDRISSFIDEVDSSKT